MARLKACPYCGKIHKGDCPKRPKDYHVKQDKIRKFRKSREWVKMREYILERDNYCCQISLQKGKIVSEKGLHVHHIIPISNNWDLRLDPRNLITLSPEEHTNVHNGMYNTTDIQELINSKYD